MIDPRRSTCLNKKEGMATTGSAYPRAGAAPGRDRFDREKYFPSGWQLGTPEFLSLFHRFSYIYKPLTGGSWLSAEEKWSLTDTEILKAIACAHPRFFLGCRAGRATRFGVLDIDANSRYHDPTQLKKIQDALAAAGIKKTVLYRSSRSGGWHLYIFFGEPISSRDLQNQLAGLLSLNGFKIAKGTLEIFPSPGDHSLGYGLRLPLQPGWAWLDKQTGGVQYEREDMHAMEALGMFLADVADASNSMHEFHQLKRHVEELQARREKSGTTSPSPESAKAPLANVVPLKRTAASNSDPASESVVISVFKHLPPNINPPDWLRGRQYYAAGLYGPSQRADAIFSIGHYLFYGDPEIDLRPLGYGCEAERQWVIEQILNAKHNDYSDDINNGRADAFVQIERATHWLPAPRRDREARPYKMEVPPAWPLANAKRKLDARQRIICALNQIAGPGKTFTLRQLRRQAKCSMDTIYKHKDLWQHDYEDLASDSFANDPGEYNAVVDAADPEIPSPVPVDPPLVDMGLLAARRIAFEIALRRNWQKKKKLTKTEQRKKDNAEAAWKERVTSAIAESLLPERTLRNLQAIVAFLTFCLLTAPCEEDATWLHSYIGELKNEIDRRSADIKLKLVPGRAPPDTG